MKQALSLIFLCLCTLTAFSQTEWESCIPSDLKWDSDPKLTTTSTALSRLRVSNLTTESLDNKKNNKFGLLSVSLNQSIPLAKPCEISFTVKNTNNNITGPKMIVTGTKKKVKGGRVAANIAQTILLFPWGIGSWWWNPCSEIITIGHLDDSPSQVYWGYSIGVKSTYGSYTRFDQYFRHHGGHIVDQKNSDTNKWERYYNNSGTENLKLVFDRDKTLNLYSGSNLVKSFPNAEAILVFQLNAGCYAKLETSNFSMRRKTDYGMVKPMLDEATTMMQQENWHGASKLLSEIIDENVYRNFKIYYLKGYCQMALNNFRTAIEYLTKAINFPSATTTERENAYYLRGYCKALLEDIDCVTDMRKAGEDGEIWLREKQLDNFNPNQNATRYRSTSPKSSNIKGLNTSKKPPLKK